MDLGRINSPNVMSLFNPYRGDVEKTGGSPAKNCKEPDLTAVAQKMSRYQVHIEQHRTLEVGLRLNVGTGKGVQVDMNQVAKAKEDPAFADLQNMMKDFDALTEDQKNMVYAAGAFMKDRSPEGYQQLLDFVEKAKSHAAANPGKAFAMDFQFKSSESLVVDYYEETHEAAMISTKGGQESEQISHYKQSTVSARRVVYSQTFQVSGMLMGLGEVLADLKAGVKPEADKALEGKDKAPELPKPGSATADLLDELLEDLDKPLEVEIPNVIKDKKDHPLHPDHPVFDENPGLLTRQKDRGYVPVVADEDRQAKGNPKPLTELVVGYA